MIPSVYRISLDVHDAHSSVCLDMKRQDTARQISIALTDGGFPYKISEECYAIFTATKADGHIIAHPCEIKGNIILYDVHAQTTAAVGLAECEIKLYGADDKLITSPGFNILVSSTSYTEGDIIESEDHVTVLGHLISEATTVITKGEEVNAEAEALIAELETEKTALEGQVAAAEEAAEDAKTMAQSARNHANTAEAAAYMALQYSAKPDLAQNDPAVPGYIKNRTHWVESSETVIAWDGNVKAKRTYTDAFGKIYYKISDKCPEESDVIGATIEYSSGNIQTVSSKMFSGFTDGQAKVGSYIYLRSTPAVSAGNVIDADAVGVYAAIVNDVYPAVFRYGKDVVHTLDEKFIPDTIARKTDIPTVPDSSQNADLTGYATEQYVKDYAQPKGNYLESTELTNAVNTALAQAKASGEFDGKDGADGQPGAKGDKGDPGEKGEKGATGATGSPGTSVTVKSVSQSTADGGSNVVTFSDGKTVTIKNGSKGSTGSKGDKGDKGDQGPAGSQGIQGPAGADGVDGKSAYQYAQEGGYTGTEEAFAAKLAAENGTPDAVQYTPQSLTPEQQAQARENIGAADAGIVIPDYWVEHLAEKIATIKEHQRANKDCYSFVVLADYHRPRNKVNYSPTLIKRIMDECGIKFCLCLGDIQNGGAWKTKALEMADWDAIEKEFMPIRDRLLMTPGNHDGAYGSEDINGDGQISGSTDYYIYNLTPGEVYDLVLRKTGLIDGVVFDESKNGYYVDDNVSKVRYILVNTHYTDGAVNADGTAVNNIMRKIRVGQPQMNMVISALNGIPSEDWTVIVGMHIPLAPLSDSGPSADMVLLRDVLEAYQGKTTYTNTFGVAGEYDYLNIDVDFTAAHGTVVGAFCGHIHRDGVNTDYSFPVVTSYSDDTSATNIFGDVEDGTIQKHSFDVFTVNRNENIIYATKFGYGEDRVIGMGNMFWRVFLSLDGANASNTEQVVEKNGSYTTTITAKAGYTIESVVVTMGGVDITADVYADGVITIGSVTGDVSITVASAVLYTNLADPTSEDWYSESHFINTDGEFLQTTAPYTETLFVTNFIPVKKFDILRWKGINMEALVSGYGCGIRCYDENKEFIRTVATMESTRGTASGLPTSCATDENGVTAWEIMIRGDTNQQFTYNSLCDKIRYVRFCAHWLTTVEDIIITVNEEIVPSEDNPGDDVVTLYTNLADPSSEDWMEAASYNAGVIDRYQYSEYRGTNFIPVNTNDVLRFKGVDISDDNYNLLVCYDEHKEYLIALGLGASHSNSIAPVMSTDENGVSSYTILMRGSTGQQWVYNDLYTKTKYIRFYGGRDVVAEDVIITVNEEII